MLMVMMLASTTPSPAVLVDLAEPACSGAKGPGWQSQALGLAVLLQIGIPDQGSILEVIAH